MKNLIDIEGMTSSIVSQINSAKIEADPFPHFSIENLLPEVVIDSLLETFPSEDVFSSGITTSKGRRVLYYNSPDATAFRKNAFVWDSLISYFESSSFHKLLLDKLAPYIKDTGGHYETTDSVSTQVDLSQAGSGYVRSPHLDRRNHIANTFLYLNGKDSQDWNGDGGDLLLHRLVHPDVDIYDKFPASEDLTVAKLIPVKRNLFVCFLPCSHSYHSVTPIAHAEGYRKFAYIALNNDDRDDMWPETRVFSEERRLHFLSQ